MEWLDETETMLQSKILNKFAAFLLFI